LDSKFPGSRVQYLDANFPFLNGFPLEPHLSHSDGKKLDLTFLYTHNGIPTNYCPSFIGYGGSEKPKNGEEDRPSYCENKGYWQYNILTKLIPIDTSIRFDEQRTKAFMQILVKNKSIKKILLEPHLKQRLNLTSQKIRLHGCHAIRHDDHVHIQL
jgi:hypothetical protein